MSKGGGSTRTITQQTAAPEYAQPFLEYGLSEAQRLYESPTPQYYPESTVVGFSPETQMALGAMRQQAVSGSPFIPATQNVVMQNLMGTNPLQSAAFRPVVEQVESQAAKAGRYGSGYQQAAVAQALAPYAYQAQQAAIQQAPAAREFGFADYGTLGEIGAVREAQAGAELAADIERFQFEQARPASKLADYLTMVSGGSGALGGQTITPQFRQPALGALSGGLAGAQLGQAFGASGASGLAPFAIGGGLLGMMG
jgi:hypothetical protein